jgi:peptidoglycan hydrolase-like protein with peptidoglycan-binding domain
VRRRPVVGGLLAVAAVAAVGGAVVSGAVPAGALFAASSGATPSAPPAAVKTATIKRETMASTDAFDGTLGYLGDITISGGSAGTLTWVPAPGTIIKRGDKLYELDGARRPRLFYGTRPLWRTLEAGVSDGADVLEIEQNLKALGYAPSGMKVNRHWDSKTTTAVKRWEKATGQTRDGIIELGDVAIQTGPIRVVEAKTSLGSGVGPGAAIFSATGTTRVVTVNLSASHRDELPVGAAVTITLPDETTIAGKVRSVGRVASVDQQSGSATIPVTITLDDPAAAADLDQAPVTVEVTSESHPNVLTVPNDALVALLEGGYAVEVVDASGAHRYVAVTLGLSDDRRVEISGSGLEAGMRVVVPS